jgi:hypothetical protein
MKNRVLIITGMHRSGTSLVARFIHHSGIDLGESMLGANPGNRYGHFEDEEFLEFHRQVLKRNFGHNWQAPGPPRLSDDEARKGRELIARRAGKADWGWKDPRTSLFLDFWDRFLPEAHYLFMVRHPLSVIDSLARRDKIRVYQYRTHRGYYNGYLVYNRECLRFCAQNRSRCVLAVLEDVVKRPEAFVKLLGGRLSRQLDPALFRSLYDDSALKEEKDYRRMIFWPDMYTKCARLYRELRQKADALP